MLILYTIKIAIIVLSLIVFPNNLQAYLEYEQPKVIDVIEVEKIEEVKEVEEVEEVAHINIPHTLAMIAKCESGGTHYKANGEVIRGIVNNLDVGKFQINLKYHQSAALKMGLDLLKEEDNTTYAIHLFNTQGTAPWNASKHCWSKYI